MTTISQITHDSPISHQMHPVARWLLGIIGAALLGYVGWSVCFVLCRLVGVTAL